MKIRKFNEARKEVDLEYVRNCFADLIDAGKARVEERVDDGGVPYENITIKLIKTEELGLRRESISKNRLRDHMEACIKNAETMEEILLSLDRIADEYPSYEVLYEMLRNSIFIQIKA